VVVCLPADATSLSAKASKHVVRKVETVWAIARKYGVEPERIIELNNLKEPDKILPGRELMIPRAGSSASDSVQRPPRAGATHIVQKGETVWGIARTYGVKPEQIIAANKLKKPYVIHPGQALMIPGVVPPKVRQQKIASLCRLPRGVRPRKWRYIVIHHSATPNGNAASFGRHHRRLGMRNGLAYHFVIGNGNGAGDGLIEVGGRWTRQLHGGHVRSQRMNEIGIGICLVGNLEKTHPTRKQMEGLVFLLKYLVRKYNIPERRVIGHRDVRGGDTRCPGRNLSLVQLRRKL